METELARRILILGTPLSLWSETELLDTMRSAVVTQRRITVLSGNVYAYNLAYEHAWLRRYFNQVDAVRLDGEGVRLGARILGHIPPERMTWADFGWSLADYAAQHELTLFLLGSKPGIAEKAASRLKEHNVDLRIVGVHHGYFDKSVGSPDNETILAQINATKPDILVVGFGMPLQEHWLSENRERIDANVVITGGAVFDYLSGELRRGPRLLTENGFEWLARLIIEPRRLWKRYILGNPLFIARVLMQRLGLLRLSP